LVFAEASSAIAVIPQGAWHRAFFPEGKAEMTATPFPGDHIELDVDDPRTVGSNPGREIETRTPSIIDLNAELANLTMFRGRTPQSTMADRKGSPARLASYRDGALTTTKFSGKGHWESHLAGDELVDILDGTATLEIVCDDGPPKSFAVRALDRGHSPGCMAPLFLVGGRDLDDRDTLSQRGHRARCRRPSDGGA
jgi:hypothetical protein